MNAAMPPLPSKRTQLSTVLYWLSMLLLVWGGRTLIDPSNRHGGEVEHVYITLVAFEAYIWLLLLIARWQARRGLVADVGRFGIFAIFLQGLIFMALNELHMASQIQGLIVTSLCVVLAAAKVAVAPRWMNLLLPTPLAVSSLAWIFVMAIPGVILRAYGVDFTTTPYTVHYEAQHLIAFASCWTVAIFIALHLPLVRWQKQQGFEPGEGLRQWWVPWIASGGLLAMAIAQLYTTMWGLFVDWSQWYFSPIYVALAAIAVTLTMASGRQKRLAILMMMGAGLHFLLTYAESRPSALPVAWGGGLGAYVMHPLYMNGLFFSLLFAAAAWLLGRKVLWAVAAVLPVGSLLYKGATAVAEPISKGANATIEGIESFRHSKGVLLLLSAFLLLGAGVAVQRNREKKKARLPLLPPAGPAAGESEPANAPLNAAATSLADLADHTSPPGDEPIEAKQE